MTEFKVGDKVRCIFITGIEGFLTIGKIYSIIGIEKGTAIILKLVDDKNTESTFFSSRFEKVEDNDEAYEVILPFTLYDIWIAFKDNHNCKEFQKAWGILLSDFYNSDNSCCVVKEHFIIFNKNCIPKTLWKYRDKLEEKGFIKKVKKEIYLKPGMRIVTPQDNFTYCIINCSYLSSKMTHFNILVEQNNFCYEWGKIYSCDTLEELNKITGENFEVIDEE